MKRNLLNLIFILFTVYNLNSQNKDFDSIHYKLYELEHKVKIIDSSQLNYQIEKDLLKETYSNNYNNISLVITLILGVIGVFAYLGLKDVTSIKKEYLSELENLKKLKSQFELKTIELNKSTKKIDNELKSILEENQKQNDRIKFIELKDKAEIYFKEDNISSALEFINAALEIKPNDPEVLTYKGILLSRLNNFPEAQKLHQKVLDLDPTHFAPISNLAECLYFNNEIKKAKEFIQTHKNFFENFENGELLEFFNLIELYHKTDIKELISRARRYANENLEIHQKRMSTHDLKEAYYFIHHKPENEAKIILLNILSFWDGQINGETLLKKLKID